MRLLLGRTATRWSGRTNSTPTGRAESGGLELRKGVCAQPANCSGIKPDNASCHNGLLVIERRAARAPAEPDLRRGIRKSGAPAGNSSSTTPRAPTLPASIDHQYGRFEIRARINTDLGSLPAFWTLGTHGGWPANGEIDIMEYYRHMLLANIAWQGAVTTGGPAVWNSHAYPSFQARRRLVESVSYLGHGLGREQR